MGNMWSHTFSFLCCIWWQRSYSYRNREQMRRSNFINSKLLMIKWYTTNKRSLSEIDIVLYIKVRRVLSGIPYYSESNC